MHATRTFADAVPPHYGPSTGDLTALRAYIDLLYDKGEGRGHSSGFWRPLGAGGGLLEPKFEANPSRS